MENSIETMRDRGAVRLAMAIIQKAADDYRDLYIRGVTARKTRYEGNYSEKEIKDFFRGRFCERMLRNMYISDHGKNLFNILERERFLNKRRKIRNLKP